jgi:hypothetical protein
MKTKITVLAMVSALMGIQQGFSQGLLNLNFESANTSGYSSGSFIPTNNAVPGWTAYYGSLLQSTIPYNTIALDAASVDLEGTNSQYGPYPIQGDFSVFIQGGTQFDPDTNGAAIMQTGLIPSSAKSIIYWGGALQVTFDGQVLLFDAIGSGSGYTIWQADISAYAGQTGQLEFTAPWQSSGLLDNIQFSSSPVPEPGAFALSALGGTYLVWRRWKMRA